MRATNAHKEVLRLADHPTCFWRQDHVTGRPIPTPPLITTTWDLDFAMAIGTGLGGNATDLTVEEEPFVAM
jgi:hypothetical protein